MLNEEIDKTVSLVSRLEKERDQQEAQVVAYVPPKETMLTFEPVCC